MKSSNVNTEPLSSNAYFQLMILSTMIVTCVEFLEKSLINL